MSINERLKKVIKWMVGSGLAPNQEEIGKLLGYKNKSSFSQVLNGKVPLPGDFITRLCAIDKTINRVWIEDGIGQMLLSTPNAKTITEFEFLQVPFIPIHAQAGYSRGYGDLEYIETLPKIPVITDKTFKGKYRVFEVSGDSMDNGMRDSFADKDLILCREVMPEYWKSKLHIRDWYFVIVCKNDGIFVKKIIDHDVEKGLITCHSLNQMYEDFVIDLRDVAELYNVIKLVDRSARL